MKQMEKNFLINETFFSSSHAIMIQENKTDFKKVVCAFLYFQVRENFSLAQQNKEIKILLSFLYEFSRNQELNFSKISHSNNKIIIYKQGKNLHFVERIICKTAPQTPKA
jgi:hypothetical protein